MLAQLLKPLLPTFTKADLLRYTLIGGGAFGLYQGAVWLSRSGLDVQGIRPRVYYACEDDRLMEIVCAFEKYRNYAEEDFAEFVVAVDTLFAVKHAFPLLIQDFAETPRKHLISESNLDKDRRTPLGAQSQAEAFARSALEHARACLRRVPHHAYTELVAHMQDLHDIVQSTVGDLT